MSHVTDIKTVFKDLEAIKATCTDLGLKFKQGQKTYGWWGYSVGDYPLPAGFTKDDLGKCEHAIGVPGTEWEVGVVRRRNADGSLADGYTLMFDYYGGRGQPILTALGGTDAKKFRQSYSVNWMIMAARKRGHMVTRTTEPNGVIRVQITGRTL